MKLRTLFGFAFSILLLAYSLIATAQDFPSKRITLVVPFPSGSATDGTARRIAAELSRIANVPVLVDNKPGADGNIAAMHVLRSDPDGYTVFVTTNSTHAANVNLFKTLPFDPKADFVPVTGIATIPIMLTVRADFPAKTLAEFIALTIDSYKKHDN
jgi:tripartite-type tricarboxylate transporter receptor subunit TctC